MAIKLSIVTPERDVLNVDADEVIVPAKNGEIGLLPGHIPLISALNPGVLTTIRGGKRAYHVVNFGFVEIEGDQVRILTDTCEDATQVDVDRARRALHGAQEKMKTLGPEEAGYEESHRRAKLARARLEGAARVDPSVRAE